MEAILKFDLESPDDRQAHLRSVMALDMAIAMWEFEQSMRKLFNDEDSNQETLEEVNALWNRTLESNNIQLDKLIS